MWKVSYSSIVRESCQFVICDDLKVGGNNGILEIFAPNLNTYNKEIGPLHEQIFIAPKWSSNPLST